MLKHISNKIDKTVTEQLAGSLNRYILKRKLNKSWKEIIKATQKLAAKEIAQEA